MMWCTQPLKRGDTLATLAEEFSTTPEAIAEANGVPWDVQAINAWVISSGGKWLPQAGRIPIKGSKTGGWAVFKAGNKIQLPCSENEECKCQKKKGVCWLKLGIAFAGGYLAKKYID